MRCLLHGAPSPIGMCRSESRVRSTEIREGTTLAAALDRPKVFPKLAVEMLSVRGGDRIVAHDVA